MKQIDIDFMNFFKKTGNSLGLEGLMMDLGAYLYLQPGEVAMDEIAKKTGYSLASISNSMKSFEQMGLVTRIKKPGTKKVFFYMDKNIFNQNIKKFRTLKEYGIKPAKDFIPPMIEKYKNLKDESTKKKVNILSDYLIQVDEMNNILDDFVKKLEKLSKKYNEAKT
ncbi:MAG: GbsR/MarR family transcriptional regulator [Minisyncoccales bacterium]